MRIQVNEKPDFQIFCPKNIKNGQIPIKTYNKHIFNPEGKSDMLQRNFLRIIITCLFITTFRPISANFTTCSILISPDQQQTCVLLGDDHPSQKFDQEAQQFAILDTFFSSYNRSSLLVLIEDYAAHFHDFPAPKHPLLLPQLATMLNTKYAQKQNLSHENIDPRVFANFASDFLNPVAIPATIGLPPYVYTYTFQNLFDEYIELAKHLTKIYPQLNLPATQDIFECKLIEARSAFLELKDSLLGQFDTTNDTPILQTATQLWLSALLEYFSTKQPTVQMNIALTGLHEFEQKLPALTQNYALFSPKTKNRHGFVYKTHLKTLFFNPIEPITLPLLFDTRATLRHKIMDCFTPLVDIYILHQILSHHEQANILVMTGFVHAGNVRDLLLSLGYSIKYEVLHIDDFSHIVKKLAL